MTYYHDQVLKISRRIYAKDDLTRQIIRAKHFIDKNYADKINLHQVASEACISKFHFIRLFKLYYGITPNQHLGSVRIQRAKEYLADNLAVADVCFAVGFDSIPYFTTLFKKMTGTTPALFQKKARAKKAIYRKNLLG